MKLVVGYIDDQITDFKPSVGGFAQLRMVPSADVLTFVLKRFPNYSSNDVGSNSARS
uniref:Uncharacterized protein n=1 Tax=Pseudomonas syringae pv. actinidiae TaxID=103796 RepID=M1J6Q9_PSESF|nr:hypothetical protein [Pseudomonas syringae pv. actinidiae]